MYKKIRIENFKGIDHLEIDDPRQFNLIVGKNNTFKTTILESIFFITGPTNPSLALSINYFRDYGVINDHSWSLYYHRLDTQTPVELYAEVAAPPEKRRVQIEPIKDSDVSRPGDADEIHVSKGSHSTSRSERITGLSFTYTLDSNDDTSVQNFTSKVKREGKEIKEDSPEDYNNTLKGIFIPARHGAVDNVRRFNEILVKKQKDKIIKILQKIEPVIQDISVGYQDILYCDMGFDQLIPINMVGGGINRILSIMMAIYNAANGVVMIDEVENGLHYSTLEILWKAIFESAAEFNVQVFATTHSMENIMAYRNAYENFAKEEDRLRLFRVEKEGEKLKLISINHEMLKSTLEFELEVR